MIQKLIFSRQTLAKAINLPEGVEIASIQMNPFDFTFVLMIVDPNNILGIDDKHYVQLDLERRTWNKKEKCHTDMYPSGCPK